MNNSTASSSGVFTSQSFNLVDHDNSFNNSNNEGIHLRRSSQHHNNSNSNNNINNSHRRHSLASTAAPNDHTDDDASRTNSPSPTNIFKLSYNATPLGGQSPQQGGSVAAKNGNSAGLLHQQSSGTILPPALQPASLVLNRNEASSSQHRDTISPFADAVHHSNSFDQQRFSFSGGISDQHHIASQDGSPKLMSIFNSPASMALSADGHHHHHHFHDRIVMSNQEHALSITNLQKLEEQNKKKNKKTSFFGISDDDSSGSDGGGGEKQEDIPTAPSCCEQYCCLGFTNLPAPVMRFLIKNKIFFRLAIPSFITQFLRNFISVTSFAFAGRLLDKKHLASFILGFSFTNAIGIAIGMGISSVLDTLCTSAAGFHNGRSSILGMHLRTAFCIIFFYSIFYFIVSAYLAQEAVKMLKPDLVEASQAFLVPSVSIVFGTTCTSATHKFLNSLSRTEIALKGYMIGSIVSLLIAFIIYRERDGSFFEGDQIKIIRFLALTVGFCRALSGLSMFLIAMRDPDVYFCWTGKILVQQNNKSSDKNSSISTTAVIDKEMSETKKSDDDDTNNNNINTNNPHHIHGNPTLNQSVDTTTATFTSIDDDKKLLISHKNNNNNNNTINNDEMNTTSMSTDNMLQQQQNSQEDNNNNNNNNNINNSIQEQVQQQAEQIIMFDSTSHHLWLEALRPANLYHYLSLSIHSILTQCADRWTFEIFSVFIATSQYTETDLDSFGLLATIWIFLFPPAVSCYVAASTTVGNWLGKGKGKRAMVAAWRSVYYGFWVTLFFCIIYTLFPSLILKMFVTNEEIISSITKVVPLYNAGLLADAIQFVFQGSFMAMGEIRVVSRLSMVTQWLLSMPLAAVLVLKLDLGLIGLGAALIVGNWIRVFYFYFALKEVRWDLLAFAIKQQNEAKQNAASPVPGFDSSPSPPSNRYLMVSPRNSSSRTKNSNNSKRASSKKKPKVNESTSLEEASSSPRHVTGSHDSFSPDATTTTRRGNPPAVHARFIADSDDDDNDDDDLDNNTRNNTNNIFNNNSSLVLDSSAGSPNSSGNFNNTNSNSNNFNNDDDDDENNDSLANTVTISSGGANRNARTGSIFGVLSPESSRLFKEVDEMEQFRSLVFIPEGQREDKK